MEATVGKSKSNRYAVDWWRIDGEDCAIFETTSREVRFLKALAEACMIKRLSNEEGLMWLAHHEYKVLDGLKRDGFEKAAMLKALEQLGLIKGRHKWGGYPGLYEESSICISEQGQQVLQLFKEGIFQVKVGKTSGCVAPTVAIDG